MNIQLYNEIIDLIDDTARGYREKEQELLDRLEDPVSGPFCIEELREIHKKAKAYEDLLDRFDKEVAKL